MTTHFRSTGGPVPRPSARTPQARQTACFLAVLIALLAPGFSAAETTSDTPARAHKKSSRHHTGSKTKAAKAEAEPVVARTSSRRRRHADAEQGTASAAPARKKRKHGAALAEADQTLRPISRREAKGLRLAVERRVKKPRSRTDREDEPVSARTGRKTERTVSTRRKSARTVKMAEAVPAPSAPVRKKRPRARRTQLAANTLVDQPGASIGEGPARSRAGARTSQRPRPAAQAAPNAPEWVSFNYSDTDVKQVLANLADYARVDIVVTPGATGTVTISLRNRTPDEAVRLVAAAAGLSVLKTSSSYIVGPVAEVRKTAAELGQATVVALRRVSPSAARELLLKVTPSLSVEVAGNAVVISGLPADVDVARAALRELEAKPAELPVNIQTQVAQIRLVDPAPVERVLREAFPGVKIARQERTLVLTGPALELESVIRAVKELDVAPPQPVEAAPVPEVRTARVYRLNYLNARTAAETIKKALPNLVITAAPEPNAPPAALFQPLTLGSFGGGAGGGLFGSGGLGGGTAGATAQNTIPGVEPQPLSRSTRLIMIGTDAELATATRLLEQTDVAPPRVNIQADLVEINRTDAKNLGVNWDFDNLNATIGLPGGSGVQFGTITRSDVSFNVSLQALMRQNRARVLARPNISVVDNEDANIFIGDLVRFPGSNVISPNVGTVQGTDTIPVGIALLVRPRVHPGGDITLKVHPVISSVTSFVNNLPQTSSREADTTVRLADGEALIIGGLQREEDLVEIRKVPGLGDLPLLGQLFRSRNRTKNKTEIMVVIRASGVKEAQSEKSAQGEKAPPSPTAQAVPAEPETPAAPKEMEK